MATAPAWMTMEQYLRTSFSPDVDFVHGEIEERNVGEFDHGYLQGILFSWFLTQRRTLHALPVVEQRVYVSESQIRICDVAVVSTEKTREQVARTPPVVCIEILSPDDRIARAERVLADYRNMGVENIWLIDPIRRVAYSFDREGLHKAPENVLRIAGTEVALDMNTLFEALDEPNP